MHSQKHREGLPTFEPLALELDALLQEGRRLAMEQEHVKKHRLSQQYLKHTGSSGGSLIGLSG